MNDGLARGRYILSGICLGLAITGLGVRLAFLHLGEHDKIRSGFDRTRRVERKLLAPRGNIYDRHGRKNILALTLAVQDVCADPALIVQTNAVIPTATELAKILELPVDEVAIRLNRPERRFAYIKRFVHMDKVDVLKDRSLPGVFYRDTTVRYYPQNDFLCHVLGFVNYEGVGSLGVEQRMDKYLRGAHGFVESGVNAMRQEVYSQRGSYVPALEGGNVSLTIDQNVQYMVERALDQAMIEHNAKGAWAIVQRIKTGEILAMASRPSFDLNGFRRVTEQERLNRAIGVVYEPGSTFKAALFAAALNEGVVTPDTVFDCENGSWLYGRRILRDYHPYGNLSVADGLKKSSNIMSAKLALLLGEERLHDYLSDFMIGHRLGIELPGEEAGILHPVRDWSNISATRIAIGQGVAVTALQMLNVFCCIANDGYMMRPYVVREVCAADGSIISETRPEVISQPISVETARTMRHLLGRITEQGGTGRRACVEGYRVAGKTGTAQKPVNGAYSDTAHVASFAGFLPVSDPEIGVIVVVDEPQPRHTGGYVAAPAFSVIAGQTVRYLGVKGDDNMVAATLPSRDGSLIMQEIR